jgi:seryl-tRNA synthetase
MLDPALLRSRLAETAARLKETRGFTLDVVAVEALESQRKQLSTETQELQNLRNTRSKAIGQAKAKGEDVAPLMAEVAGIGDKLKANEQALADVQAKLADIALGIPNIPHESVPVGKDENDNRRNQPLGHAAQLRFRGQGSRRTRRTSRLARWRCGRQTFRRTLHRAARSARATASCARPVHARSAHRASTAISNATCR